MTGTPNWIVEGAPVVIYRSHRNSSGTADLEATTVDRILKRDVVLANGDRFNLERLSKSNGTWETPTELLHPHDPRVEAARAANVRSRRESRVRTLCDRAAESVTHGHPDKALPLLAEATAIVKSLNRATR